jgi:hypothetical protein
VKIEKILENYERGKSAAEFLLDGDTCAFGCGKAGRRGLIRASSAGPAHLRE